MIFEQLEKPELSSSQKNMALLMEDGKIGIKNQILLGLIALDRVDRGSYISIAESVW